MYTHLGLAGCRECKRLYDRDRLRAAEESARKCGDVTSAGGSESVSPPPEAEMDRPEDGKAGSGRVVEDVGSGSDGDGAAPTADGSKALTPAQRQKRWRDKDPDGYRKWNRERMKRVRRQP